MKYITIVALFAAVSAIQINKRDGDITETVNETVEDTVKVEACEY